MSVSGKEEILISGFFSSSWCFSILLLIILRISSSWQFIALVLFIQSMRSIGRMRSRPIEDDFIGSSLTSWIWVEYCVFEHVGVKRAWYSKAKKQVSNSKSELGNAIQKYGEGKIKQHWMRVLIGVTNRSDHLGLYGQVTKRTWWMPWQLEAMKDVVVCEKLG